ncbi:hypothetical protein ABIB39_004700 [Mucilaginibacter sp. UYP27]
MPVTVKTKFVEAETVCLISAYFNYFFQVLSDTSVIQLKKYSFAM